MLITFNQLNRDTRYFVTQRIGLIFLISVIVACIYQFLHIFIRPHINMAAIINSKILNQSYNILDLINHMNFKEKKILLQYLFIQIIKFLINQTLLLGAIITLLTTLSNEKKKQIVFSINDYIKILPHMFMLLAILFFIIQIGFIFFIFPGILLFSFLSLSPITLYFQRYNIIDSIYYSLYFSWKYISIISYGIIFWICLKYFVIFILSNLAINKNLLFLVFNISNNILYSILVIYFFRFYMIINRLDNV